MAAVYEDVLTLGAARARYFAANGFGDGGYDARWVVLKAGPVPIPVPNTQARVRSVRLHDLHHVVTGYDTTWTGEAEIGAWEIASGCADHHAAWVLNLLALAVGLALDPRAMWGAFRRGRRSGNLYRTDFDERMLVETVGEMRRRLRLADAPTPGGVSVGDAAAFAGWSAAAIATLLVVVALTFAPIVALVLAVTR
jgi:hypothetical protein